MANRAALTKECMRRPITTALVLTMGAMLAWPVCAQTGGGAGRSGPSAGARGGGGMPSDRPSGERPTGGANLNELVALRMSQLEEDLLLQPPQSAAWNRFRDSVQRLLEDRRRAARTVATEATAPQRLDALADGARNRLAAVEDVVDAGKALYAMLSTEQRVVADRRLALPLATLAGTETRPDDRGVPGGRPPGGPGGGGGPPRP
jgi:hypothetical protein